MPENNGYVMNKLIPFDEQNMYIDWIDYDKVVLCNERKHDFQMKLERIKR